MSFDFGCPTISAIASLTCSSLYMFSYSTIYVTGGKQHGPRCQCKAYACGEDTWRCKSPGKWSYRTFRLYKQFVAWKQTGSRCYWVKKQVEPLYITPQGAAWRSGLHVWLVMWRSWVWPPSKAPIVSLSKKLYPYCLVLVGYRNGFERDITIKLE